MRIGHIEGPGKFDPVEMREPASVERPFRIKTGQEYLICRLGAVLLQQAIEVVALSDYKHIAKLCFLQSGL